MQITEMARRSNRDQDRAVDRFLRSIPQSQRNSAGRRSQMQNDPESRIYLAVPYPDIAKARALGAEFDSKQRLCWIATTADRTPFAKWIVDESALRHAGINQEDVLADFRDAMKSYQLVPDRVIPDGKWHCANIETRNGPRLNGSYRLEFKGGVWRGYIRNFKGASGPWRFKSGTLSREQRAALEAQDRERRAIRDAERLAEQRAVARRTLGILTGLARAGHDVHPYLKRKGVGAYGLRLANGSTDDMAGLLNLAAFKRSRDLYLVVPGRGVDDSLLTAQVLGPDGSKLFVKGARKTGAFHLIGAHRVADLANAPAVLFAEGYATGATLYEATGVPVVVCFDADNLVQVAKELVRVLPMAQPKVVCADNDQYFLDGALERIAELGTSAPSPAQTLMVYAGAGEQAREVVAASAVADGQWHVAVNGKYRLSVERMRGLVRGVTIDIVKSADDPHIRLTTRNKGLEAGEEAARILRGRVVSPAFISLVGRPTDFNDLATVAGRSAVTGQIQAVLPFPLHREDNDIR
ncbi:DUF5710 domain-containing protein [Burkholderia stagnalis]|uniref:DUF5710 domain-containing protein n=1 Tax=Burkholderia stagnalis TaxID=1503054 RepID=UPI00075FD744|nr:DUF5710 domain-containing protein [Burkholderia stagnalis]KWK69099.1 DNA primase [Burkholderia stagnalis]